jgi:hypothetical protein
METKEDLINNIKGWIGIDTEIARLQKELREKRAQKRLLSDELVNTMKNNKIDCFDIKGGALLYKKNVTKKPLTTKTMLPLLEAYFKESDVHAEEVAKYLMDNRGESVKDTVRHKIDKK